jgi:hypothetical protein
VSRRLALSLLGAVVLTGFSIASLPFERGLFHVPQTPYDAHEARDLPGTWILMSRAERLIPPGASVIVRSEPPDANADSYLHRFGVALLPGRRIVPAALWGVPTPPQDLRADYEIVVGRPPAAPPGDELLALHQGTVWRLTR